jgi:hypothetical protein
MQRERLLAETKNGNKNQKETGSMSQFIFLALLPVYCERNSDSTLSKYAFFDH